MESQEESARYQEIYKKISFDKSGITFKCSGYGSYSYIEAQKRTHLGGIGIRNRSIEELDRILPGIKVKLSEVNGKIVFLGNGLSEAPFVVSNKYLESKINQPPIINDVFDYKLLLEDLISIKEIFTNNNLDFPMESDLKSAYKIVEQIDNKSVVPVNYFLGEGDAPNILKDADLIVNSHGPPISTIEEQVSLLAVGGKLYANLQCYNVEQYPTLDSRFEVIKNDVHSGIQGFIVTRRE